MGTVKDARLTQTYSFLPASWTGDAHEETDFLPIDNREEKDMLLLNRRVDNPGTKRVLMAKYWQTNALGRQEWIASNERTRTSLG